MSQKRRLQLQINSRF